MADGLEWLRARPTLSAAMVYFDPPFAHGTFGAGMGEEWIEAVLVEAKRVATITYFHCDPELLFRVQLPGTPRGVIAWKNGWVSGFKSQSTLFWPRQYQLIVGFTSRKEWRLRPVQRPRSEFKATKQRPEPSESFVYSDWWETPNPVDQMSWTHEKVGYPTQKPIELLERLVRGSTDAGDLVLDPACGSGTSIVAALRLGRRAEGCDISPEAVAIAADRIARLPVAA